LDGSARTNVPVNASASATTYFISTPPRGKVPRNKAAIRGSPEPSDEHLP